MELSILKIGDKIKDKDGTIGIVVEIKDDGRWIRFKCRPYAILPNYLSGNGGNVMRIRKFWNMRKNLIKI